MAPCKTKYTVSDLLWGLAKQAGVESQLHPSIRSGSTLHNFATQANAISKLLLGQQLLKNDNLFYNAIIVPCHADDLKLMQIIQDLESSHKSKYFV